MVWRPGGPWKWGETGRRMQAIQGLLGEELRIVEVPHWAVEATVGPSPDRAWPGYQDRGRRYDDWFQLRCGCQLRKGLHRLENDIEPLLWQAAGCGDVECPIESAPLVALHAGARVWFVITEQKRPRGVSL